MKLKSILLFAAVLIIGFVLGMLTSAQIRYNRLKPIKVFYSEERFREGFYEAIQPDEEQKIKIDRILDKYAKINSGFQSSFRKSMDSTMKEFRKEIDSNITKEQIARLRELDEKRQKMIRESRRRNQYSNSHDRDSHQRRSGSPDRSPEQRSLKQDSTDSTR
jgi:hypothetical protein